MITYRKAQIADVPVLRAMLQALSDHDGGSYSVGSEQSLRDHGFGARPLFCAAIAEKGATAMGMVIFYPDYSTHRGQPGICVQDIFVDDTARGEGIGRGLLAVMLQMQDWGAEYITLGVSADNAKAQAFYDKIGFSARGYEVKILTGAKLDALRS